MVNSSSHTQKTPTTECFLQNLSTGGLIERHDFSTTAGAFVPAISLKMGNPYEEAWKIGPRNRAPWHPQQKGGSLKRRAGSLCGGSFDWGS